MNLKTLLRELGVPEKRAEAVAKETEQQIREYKKAYIQAALKWATAVKLKRQTVKSLRRNNYVNSCSRESMK